MAQSSSAAVEPLSYPINDACAALGVGRTTLYQLAKTGKLKLVKVGKRSLITAASLRIVADEGAA
jgi:excisionase family DNA binding protein